MKTAKQTQPRARREGLIVRELPDETLVYDLERDCAHCLNQTAAFVWQHCNGRNTTREIAVALRKKFDQPADEKLVWLALDQLDRSHLLASALTPRSQIGKLTRREAVRALGLTAAVAVPVVASIVAPLPAQAATCLGTGASCSSSIQCCSGICNAGACN